MRRSNLIVPLTITIHLAIINLILLLLTPETYMPIENILCFNFAWLGIALVFNFYTISRKERFITNFHKFIRHFIVFAMAYFAIFALLDMQVNAKKQLEILALMLFVLSFYRWSFFSFRRLYRIEGGNYVNVVVIGRDKNLKKIRKTFDEPDYGYRYKGYFHHDESKSSTYLGKIDSCFDYIIKNDINEIYCMVSQLSAVELQKLICFADNNLKRIKLIPDNKEIFTRAMNVELFETIPVLNLRQSPLEQQYAKYGKRVFDIVFSSIAIVFLLSWLIPLLFVITRLESFGPLFFKQQRSGFNKKPFWCYKFRSMTVNSDANSKMATKNDVRVTKVGRILRKTSIDELPQFINVFLGDMSVVGPRPHMESHTNQYGNSIDKYMVRHFAKPGITGLAQIKGYRGEIVKKSDIINRTRMDIFYLEKWSILLDFQIVFETIYNAIRGEEKAY